MEAIENFFDEAERRVTDVFEVLFCSLFSSCLFVSVPFSTFQQIKPRLMTVWQAHLSMHSGSGALGVAALACCRLFEMGVASPFPAPLFYLLMRGQKYVPTGG